MRQQQIENQVSIEVRSAQYTVQQNRASVDSAKAALDLARQSLDAEQKKISVLALPLQRWCCSIRVSWRRPNLLW